MALQGFGTASVGMVVNRVLLMTVATAAFVLVLLRPDVRHHRVSEYLAHGQSFQLWNALRATLSNAFSCIAAS